MIDRLLDSVLSQEMIVYSEVEESEFSALVSKMKQIQEVRSLLRYHQHQIRVNLRLRQIKLLS